MRRRGSVRDLRRCWRRGDLRRRWARRNLRRRWARRNLGRRGRGRDLRWSGSRRNLHWRRSKRNLSRRGNRRNLRRSDRWSCVRDGLWGGSLITRTRCQQGYGCDKNNQVCNYEGQSPVGFENLCWHGRVFPVIGLHAVGSHSNGAASVWGRQRNYPGPRCHTHSSKQSSSSSVIPHLFREIGASRPNLRLPPGL